MRKLKENEMDELQKILGLLEQALDAPDFMDAKFKVEQAIELVEIHMDEMESMSWILRLTI